MHGFYTITTNVFMEWFDNISKDVRLNDVLRAHDVLTCREMKSHQIMFEYTIQRLVLTWKSLSLVTANEEMENIISGFLSEHWTHLDRASRLAVFNPNQQDGDDLLTVKTYLRGQRRRLAPFSSPHSTPELILLLTVICRQVFSAIARDGLVEPHAVVSRIVDLAQDQQVSDNWNRYVNGNQQRFERQIPVWNFHWELPEHPSKDLLSSYTKAQRIVQTAVKLVCNITGLQVSAPNDFFLLDFIGLKYSEILSDAGERCIEQYEFKTEVDSSAQKHRRQKPRIAQRTFVLLSILQDMTNIADRLTDLFQMNEEDEKTRSFNYVTTTFNTDILRLFRLRRRIILLFEKEFDLKHNLITHSELFLLLFRELWSALTQHPEFANKFLIQEREKRLRKLLTFHFGVSLNGNNVDKIRRFFNYVQGRLRTRSFRLECCNVRAVS